MARRWQLPLALATAVLVAEAAVLLLQPREGLITPADVDASAYFTPAQLLRAEGFRDGQSAIALARMAVEVAVLAFVAWRPPHRLVHARRPVLMGAAAGAGLAVLTTVAALPLAAWARSRAMDVGLVTQSWAGWAGDVVLGLAIGAAIAAAGAAIAVWALRRFPRRWWLPATGVVVAYAVVTTFAGPVVLDPLFNTFKPVTGQVRADVLELADRAGFDVGQVQVMDASRRTTAANAYVAGLGSTKRVVLYDTLLEDFSREEVNLVVAHELGHVHYADLRNGLLWVALVAPAGMFAVFVLTRRWTPQGGTPGAAAIPALALAIALVVPVITAISNQLSRDVEARADAYALELTGETDAAIGFERRLALNNVSDPDPPAWRTAVFGTHPPVVERIGIAVAFERARSSSTGRGPAAARRVRTRGGS